MIAKSDLIILTISSLALVAGVYRWQQNVAAPTVAAAPAPSTRVVERAGPEPVDPGRDAAATVATGLVDGTDDVARSAADTSLTVRRIGADDLPRDAGTADGRGTATPARAEAPAATRDPAVLASPAGDADRALYGVHRVRSGDILGRIAQRYGTSVQTLRDINGIDGSLIDIDDEIRYPLPAN